MDCIDHCIKRHIKVLKDDPSQFGQKDPMVDKGDSAYPSITHIHRNRKRLPNFSEITVITPTTGHPIFLERCIQSVQHQQVVDLRHLVVVDGLQHKEKADAILRRYKYKKPIDVIYLPYSVGANKWNGHRIYGSMPYIAESQWVCFLDEDNFLDPDHLSSLYNFCFEKGLDWAYSLRKIVDKEGNVVCLDNCESLGSLHPTWNSNENFIDVACFFMKRELAIEIAKLWNKPARP